MNEQFMNKLNSIKEEYERLEKECSNSEYRKKYEDLLKKIEENNTENIIIDTLKSKLSSLEKQVNNSIHIGEPNVKRIKAWMESHSKELPYTDNTVIRGPITRVRFKMPQNKHYVYKMEYIPLQTDDCIVVHCSCGETLTIYI